MKNFVARQGECRMFSKRNLLFLTVASCVAMLSSGAFATDPTPPSGTYNIIGTENYAAGRPIVTSKAYVDSRTDLAYHTLDVNKQNNLAAKNGDAKILLEPNVAGAEPNKKTISTTIVTTGENASSDDNNIPTVGAVESLVTAQATTNANTYQPKATADSSHYQVGTNGTWKQLADGTYVKPTAVNNDVKLDIDTAMVTSSTSDIVNGTNKLVTSGVLANYHDTTKVDVAQGTAYQVLTTGTTGNVTHEYLKVPVTSSGEPTSNNTPTAVASMWLE